MFNLLLLPFPAVFSSIGLLLEVIALSSLQAKNKKNINLFADFSILFAFALKYLIKPIAALIIF